MNQIKRILLSPYFVYVYLFLIVILFVTIFTVDKQHPIQTYVLPIAVVLFCIQQYRKILIRKREQK